MDKRLEKIRYFQANVSDFESYINDRIKETKDENSKKVDESVASPLETELKERVVELLGKVTPVEFAGNYPMDAEDRPDFDTRPFANTVYEYMAEVGDERIFIRMYVSDATDKVKYLSFSFDDISFNPVTGETDDYDIMLKTDELNGITPQKLKSRCIYIAKKYANERDMASNITDKPYRHRSGNPFDREGNPIRNVKTFESFFDKQAYCNDYGFTGTDTIPDDCIDYIISVIDDFEDRYNAAMDEMEKRRCTLSYADYDLFTEIIDSANDWMHDNNMKECTPEDIEEVFG